MAKEEKLEIKGWVKRRQENTKKKISPRNINISLCKIIVKSIK